jgi:hypothetical protein
VSVAIGTGFLSINQLKCRFRIFKRVASIRINYKYRDFLELSLC